jgi:hypothetical protein
VLNNSVYCACAAHCRYLFSFVVFVGRERGAVPEGHARAQQMLHLCQGPHHPHQAGRATGTGGGGGGRRRRNCGRTGLIGPPLSLSSSLSLPSNRALWISLLPPIYFWSKALLLPYHQQIVSNYILLYALEIIIHGISEYCIFTVGHKNPAWKRKKKNLT